ncbi:AAA family ATPase [candidate division CSSED10-310 bacterium]|uniref:AAA family ATPase n=1 Tax=candidate division CSSED10-310 bacterium TaxID=2855610 RepID=A0ABV6Z1X1_UNCC1
MLKESRKSVQKIVDEQIQQWIASVSQFEKKKLPEEKPKQPFFPSIAISRQRGSGGWLIGKKVAEVLDFKLFDSTILNEVAKDLKISRKVLDTVDEQVVTKMELWINRLFRNKFIEPSDFQHHLVQAVLSIAEHGRSVLIGRGAHAIIPAEKSFRIRFVAPLEIRVSNISRELNLTEDEARLDVIQKSRDRDVFLKQNFDINVNDAQNFDIVINTEYFTIEDVTRLISDTYQRRYNYSIDVAGSKEKK